MGADEPAAVVELPRRLRMRGVDDRAGDREVLERHPHALEDGEVLRRPPDAARPGPSRRGRQPRVLRSIAPSAIGIASSPASASATSLVSTTTRPATDRLGVQLPGVRAMGADRVHVDAGPAAGTRRTTGPPTSCRCRPGRHRRRHRDPPRRAARPRPRPSSTSDSAAGSDRETTTSSDTGRTAHIASRWALAWTPAPKSDEPAPRPHARGVASPGRRPRRSGAR